MADRQSRVLSPRAALLRAWMVWVVLVLLGAATTGVGILLAWQPAGEGAERAALNAGLIFNLVFFVVVSVAAFILHRRLFRKHWSAGYVTPGGYLTAEVVFWVLLSLVILTLNVSCIAQQVFMPDMLLVFGAFLLLMLSWPSGWAMTHARPHDEEDDEELLHFEEDTDTEPQR